MRYLLDKSVVRRCLKGLVGGKLTPDVQASLKVLTALSPDDLFISLETLHILTHIIRVPQTKAIINNSRLLYPVRYTKRWARRLRDVAFGREDAYLLSLATFGTDQLTGGRILGVHRLITYDYHLQNHFVVNRAKLEIRLSRMTNQLSPPYAKAVLPELVTPSELFEIG